MNDTLLDVMQERIDNWQQVKDRRAIFLQCYRAMTANTLTAVTDGRFQDAAWVTDLLDSFADYYFNALDVYEQGQLCSPIWQFTFDAAEQKKTNVLQHLFLGVNAHINYDLALTLYDVLHEEWPTLTPVQRDGRYQDYCLINDIIAETIDQVQDEVIERESPLLALVDWLGGRMDEFVVVEMLSGWREEVWRKAVEMIEMVDGDGRATLRLNLEQTCLRRAQRILST
ncbi:MAG TPA: DUF5995 family protein [Chloroflexota bacterium]|nr:DUF5995 family protein [Chloroflexota bacterium]HUM70177.1 DUF5995 family protein [Chloroflexota bacterium]